MSRIETRIMAGLTPAVPAKTKEKLDGSQYGGDPVKRLTISNADHQLADGHERTGQGCAVSRTHSRKATYQP